jgi:hypothetical protein
LDISEIGSWFMPRLAWLMILLFVLPYIAVMMDMCHQVQHWLRWGLMNLLPGLTFKLILPISAFWVARITHLNPHAWPNTIKFLELKNWSSNNNVKLRKINGWMQIMSSYCSWWNI